MIDDHRYPNVCGAFIILRPSRPDRVGLKLMIIKLCCSLYRCVGADRCWLSWRATARNRSVSWKPFVWPTVWGRVPTSNLRPSLNAISRKSLTRRLSPQCQTMTNCVGWRASDVDQHAVSDCSIPCKIGASPRRRRPLTEAVVAAVDSYTNCTVRRHEEATRAIQKWSTLRARRVRLATAAQSRLIAVNIQQPCSQRHHPRWHQRQHQRRQNRAALAAPFGSDSVAAVLAAVAKTKKLFLLLISCAQSFPFLRLLFACFFFFCNCD